MLERPYKIPEQNLFYDQKADNDFYLFLKREENTLLLKNASHHLKLRVAVNH